MNDRKTIEQKVFSFMEEHHMLKAGDRVIAGVSGGADSVCLLFVLLEYAKRVPITLAVAHIDHQIRDEAGEDARFVEEICRQEGLPFYLTKEDVRRQAAVWKCSEEEAGRRVRYEAFSRAAQDFGADKIAVAHNCNDRSETMLFHLFRGSGIKGLGSIRPVRNEIIRPILCLERREVEAYLSEREIAFCQDATNEKDDYTRNRIRHHILPYVENEIVSGCVGHMARTAELLSETEDYMEMQTQAAVKACVEGNAPCYRIGVPEFVALPIVLQKRALLFLVEELSAEKKDITYVHVKELLDLFVRPGNRTVCLPFGIRGRREYEVVYLEKREMGAGQTKAGDTPVSVDISRAAFMGGSPLRLQGFFGQIQIVCLEKFDGNFTDIPQNEYTKWFDYDKIKESLMIRTRQPGDYLTLAGEGGRQLRQPLKEYMINHKIPRRERDGIPILAEGRHVIWLMGYRISEYYKVNKNTKRILQVKLL